MRRYGRLLVLGTVVTWLGAGAWAQDAAAVKPAEQDSAGKQMILLVEALESSRAKYEETLTKLIDLYLASGDVYRLKLAQKELEALKKVPKNSYVSVAEALERAEAAKDIPEANRLLADAKHYDGLTAGNVLQNKQLALARYLELIGKYPESDKIDQAAYGAAWIFDFHIHDYRQAMLYYEKCYEWNKTTKTDARIRAARVAYLWLHDNKKAKALYIVARDFSPLQAHRDEASAMVTYLTSLGF